MKHVVEAKLWRFSASCLVGGSSVREILSDLTNETLLREGDTPVANVMSVYVASTPSEIGRRRDE